MRHTGLTCPALSMPWRPEARVSWEAPAAILEHPVERAFRFIHAASGAPGDRMPGQRVTLVLPVPPAPAVTARPAHPEVYSRAVVDPAGGQQGSQLSVAGAAPCRIHRSP